MKDSKGVKDYLASDKCNPDSEHFQYRGVLNDLIESVRAKAGDRTYLPLDEAIEVALERWIAWNLVETERPDKPKLRLLKGE